MAQAGTAGLLGAGAPAPACGGDRLDAHGDAVQVRHARQPLEARRVGRRELVHVHAARLVREPPAAAVPPAVRQRDRARASSRRSRSPAPRPRPDSERDARDGRRPRGRPPRRRRDGSAARACGRRASAGASCASRSCASAARAGRSGCSGKCGDGAVRRARAGRSHRARPRRRRARGGRNGARGRPARPVAMWSSSTMPCGERATFFERQAGAAQAEPVAGRAGAQHARRSGAAARCASPSRASTRSGRQRVGRDADPAREVVDDAPLLARLAARRHDRLGDLHERRAEEAHERDRHVLALEERGRRKDVVGVPAGVGHVEVERDHQVELARTPRSSASPSGTDSTGLPGGDEERADLALARGRDLLRDQRRRQVADHVGEVAEARAHLAVGGEPRLLGDLVERDRRPAEDRAARPVEVAGDGVQRVEQVGDQRAEAAQAGAGAPVGGGARRGGERPRQLAHRLRRARR